MKKTPASSMRNAVAIVLLVVLFVAISLYLSHERRSPSLEDQREAMPEVELDRQINKESSIDITTDTLYERELSSPFVSIAEQLKPAVVNISIIKRDGESERDYPRSLRPFHDFFRDLFPKTPELYQAPQTSGTGVIIDSKGLVLTNHHVVEQAEKILIKLSNETEREGTVVGVDPETDLALLDIGHVGSSQVAKLGDSDRIRIGDWAIAMGNQLGLDWTLTVGVISAKGRSDLSIIGGGPVYQDFIQTDASINYGNSGGPLVNIKGEVIGINTAINSGGQNIGFAIPINLAKEIIEQLLENGEVVRGYLGMVPAELTHLEKEALGLSEDVRGIFVESVQPGTPGEKGGLQPSDVIIELDDQPVGNVTDFRLRVARHKPGETLKATILRDGQEKKLKFQLANRMEFLAPDEVKPSVRDLEWMGITALSLEDSRVREFPIDVDQGVVIYDIKRGSPASGKLSIGDVIAKINDDRIHDLNDWIRVTNRIGETNKAVLIMFYREGQGNSRFAAIKK